MRSNRIIGATTFVDWNAQIHRAGPGSSAPELAVASRVLNFVGQLIGRTLRAMDQGARFDVTLRLYHGWFKGFEATPRRKALIQSAAAADFTSLSNTPNVLIRPNVEFGDTLISAAASRLHAGLGCHLPNTLRRSLRHTDEFEEKMVDTALASDLVDLAYREPQRWLIVVADDDDMIPPTFTADGIRRPTEGRVILIRNRPDTPFLKLHDLRC